MCGQSYFSHININIKRGIYLQKCEYTILLYSVDIELNQLCIPYCASRTDCLVLYVDRTAGSQACGHNEF